MINSSQDVLSQIVVYNKYAKYRKDLERRETWDEIIDRYVAMMLKKYCGEDIEQQFKNKSVKVSAGSLAEQIIVNSKYLYDKKVLPSMRALQFAGPATEKNETRVYNCSFAPVDDYRAFSEIMFLLLSGCGCGYSVQFHHIEKLPEISRPTKSRKFLIGDSIEGWSDAVKALMKAYFGESKYRPEFDFSDIREKGEPLITAGGKAPGPEPLKVCLAKVEAILKTKENGSKLLDIEVHDIICHIADAVLAGGIRRAALISLFSMDSKTMLTCKHGNWWENNPQRGRANNSAVVVRNRVKKKEFKALWKDTELSMSGEPGISFTNDSEYGFNPSLRAGTRVLTSSGVFPIEDLQDKKFIVPNLGGELSEASCWKSGSDIPLWEIELDTGEKYYASTEHKWPIHVNGRYVKCQSSELKIGDLMPINVFKRESLFDCGTLGTYDQGVIIGWLYGDGCLTKRSDSGKYVANFITAKKDGDNVLNLLLDTIEQIDGVKRKVNDRGTTSEFQVGSPVFISWLMETMSVDKKEFGLPKGIWNTWSEDCRRGFINGIFSSDGHIDGNAHGISLVSSKVCLIKDIQDLLGFYGIKSNLRYSKIVGSFKGHEGKEYDSYILRTYASGRVKFSELFSLCVKYKQELLVNSKIPNKTINQEHVIVKGIRLTELKEDVWDIGVKDETHCFQLPQVTTGNCHEISLRPYTFCNLCEINAGNISTQEDLNARSKVATFFSTLQAGFTDFHYLRPIWKTNTEKDSLVGVGMTGICNGYVLPLDLTESVNIIKEENIIVAGLLGINKAARTTTIKPSGTTSCVLSTSSGIHAWHAKYYVRNMQCAVGDDLYNYFTVYAPELIKVMDYDPKSAVIGIPMKAPKVAILREDETAIEFLERVKRFNLEWVIPGHVSGPNYNNVSATVSIKENEWEEVGEWMWENRNTYSGISALPYDGGTYADAPFQDCTEYEYNKRMHYIKENPIDLTKIVELHDNTNLSGEVACAGGQCDIQY